MCDHTRNYTGIMTTKISGTNPKGRFEKALLKIVNEDTECKRTHIFDLEGPNKDKCSRCGKSMEDPYKEGALKIKQEIKPCDYPPEFSITENIKIME